MPNRVDITPNQIIPFWTGFNHNLSRKRTSYTAVTFASIIDAKPADMATRLHNYAKMKDMYSALGERHAVQTMDQQLYAIAQQIKWALPGELGRNVLRMGGFHSLSCFIACMGWIVGFPCRLWCVRRFHCRPSVCGQVVQSGSKTPIKHS